MYVLGKGRSESLRSAVTGNANLSQGFAGGPGACNTQRGGCRIKKHRGYFSAGPKSSSATFSKAKKFTSINSKYMES